MNMIEKVAATIKQVAWEAKSKGYAGTDKAWEEMAKAAIVAILDEAADAADALLHIDDQPEYQQGIIDAAEAVRALKAQ